MVLASGRPPGSTSSRYTICALIAFIFGAVAMMLSWRVTTAPFRYVWTALGIVSLVAIALALLAADWRPIAALGEGGIERWNAYPIVLWLVAFGAYLMSSQAGGGDRRSASGPAPG